MQDQNHSYGCGESRLIDNHKKKAPPHRKTVSDLLQAAYPKIPTL